jgi:hypothetical protein
VQVHPEVTGPQVESWLASEHGNGVPRARVAADTAERIDRWNEFGRTLAEAWLDVAERAAALQPVTTE